MTGAQNSESGQSANGQSEHGQRRFRSAALAQRRATKETGALVDTTWLPRPRRPKLSVESMRTLRGADDPGRSRPRGRRVPVRIQPQVSDCGPACLQMVLAYHGVPVSIDQLRLDANAGRDGVSARSLLDAARRHGFSARGVRVGMQELRRLPPATILFWNFQHFVVLERATSSYLEVVDPAHGRRRIPLDAADAAFTGVALEFQPPLDRPSGARRGQRAARRELTQSPWQHLKHFIVPRDHVWYPLAGASLLLLLFNFVAPLASAYVVDHIHFGQPARNALALLAAVTVAVIAYFLLQLSRGLAIVSLQTIADRNVTLGVLNHLLSLPYEFFTARNAGDLAMRVRTSLDVRRVLAGSALFSVFDGLLIILYGAFLVFADAELALVVLLLAMIQLGVLAASWRGQHSLTASALDYQAEAQGDLVEMLDGITTLKAGGVEGAAGERWSHKFADEVNARKRSGRHFVWYSGLSAVVQFCAPLAVLVFGAIQVTERASSLGEVIGFSILAMGLFVPLSNLVMTGMQVAGLGRNLTRLGDILGAAPEDRHRVPGTPAQGTLPGDALSEGAATASREPASAIAISALQFSYPGSASVLHDIDLAISPGSFLAITGPSGSGKSTLATLIAGLHLPSAGQILVDGVPIEELDRTTFRRSISFVNQNAKLFAGSIYDNLLMGKPDATYEEVVAASSLAEIAVDIQRLPMGYDTLLGPDGGGLSGGQRQRIALARALIRRPRLVILDEATSALDRETEDRIFAHLTTLDCTLIVIAHQIALAAEASEIVVLEAGRITQRGTHEELIEASASYRLIAGASR